TMEKVSPTRIKRRKTTRSRSISATFNTAQPEENQAKRKPIRRRRRPRAAPFFQPRRGFNPRFFIRVLLRQRNTLFFKVFLRTGVNRSEERRVGKLCRYVTVRCLKERI